MCYWVFGGAKINFYRIMAMQTLYFRQFWHCMVLSLCNKLLLQFSMDLFETMHTCGHIAPFLFIDWAVLISGLTIDMHIFLKGIIW